MNFILKVIALGLTIQVAKALFPTFWGGFITCFVVMLASALIESKFTVDNE